MAQHHFYAETIEEFDWLDNDTIREPKEGTGIESPTDCFGIQKVRVVFPAGVVTITEPASLAHSTR